MPTLQIGWFIYKLNYKKLLNRVPLYPFPLSLLIDNFALHLHNDLYVSIYIYIYVCMLYHYVLFMQ